MEIFIENTFLLVGVISIALIVFSVMILNVQKEQHAIVNLTGNEFSGQNNRTESIQTDHGKDESKLRTVDLLAHFNEFELIQRLHQILVIERIYLQQGLTVGGFAKNLGVQPREVTQIFGELYGHSFKELTNMYRVEYAKEKIEEGFLDQFTLEALGFEAGFSSRTTFFNVFKKEIGLCPSEYWKNFLTVAA